MFITYCPIKGNRFWMGNGQTCRVVGLGNVRIKMYDGCERVSTKVRHVPIFKRDLISLSMVDQCGCKYKTLSGVLIVWKEHL